MKFRSKILIYIFLLIAFALSVELEKFESSVPVEYLFRESYV